MCKTKSKILQDDFMIEGCPQVGMQGDFFTFICLPYFPHIKYFLLGIQSRMYLMSLLGTDTEKQSNLPSSLADVPATSIIADNSDHISLF